MGFFTGFVSRTSDVLLSVILALTLSCPTQTGGVTVTLSVAYFTLLAHRRTRLAQCERLRECTRTLEGTLEATPDLLLSRGTDKSSDAASRRPSRLELAAARRRADLIESAKDAWNAEVSAAVRKAQDVDWVGLRENAEGAAVALWRTIFGSPPSSEDTAGDVAAKLGTVAEGAKKDALSVAGAATAAVTGSRSASELIDRGHEKGAQLSAVLTDAADRGVEKVREAVGVVEDKIRAATGTSDPTAATKTVEGRKLSDVERALQQRFDRDRRKGAKTVQEALAERYKPISERDNTVLRGL